MWALAGRKRSLSLTRVAAARRRNGVRAYARIHWNRHGRSPSRANRRRKAMVGTRGSLARQKASWIVERLRKGSPFSGNRAVVLVLGVNQAA